MFFFKFSRLEEELNRSSYHASANVDLHVYNQKLETECRDLRCQLILREKEKFELNEIISDFEIQVINLNSIRIISIFFLTLD